MGRDAKEHPPCPSKDVGLPFLPRDGRALLFTAVFLAVLPLVVKNNYILFLANIVALNAIIVLGLNLLVGSTGQVSLGHAAFYGLGAYLSAIASTTWHWPLACALLFSLSLVALTAFFLALPTLRLEGHYLVMATLGFNIIVSILTGQLEELTGGPSGFPGIPRLHFGPYTLSTDRAFYYLIWTVFLLLLGLTLNLTHSRIGRALHAIHEKDLTARALGIPTYRYKVIVFVLSALYSGAAGFCYAHYVTFISPKTFDIFYSVQVVTMITVGGMGNLWGGLAGTVFLTCLPELLHRFEDLHVLLYGLILMAVLVFCPEGPLAALLSLRFFRFFPLRGKARGTERDGVDSTTPGFQTGLNGGTGMAGVPSELVEAAPCPAGPALELREVSLSFGGLQALNEVSMDVLPGEIVALIGPNGAGKTTLLNVISGLLKPDSGDILLHGMSLLPLAPHTVAARGIGRTFQAAQIYPREDVLENVLLGYHVQGHSGFLASSLHTPGERHEEAKLRQQALELLRSFDLADKAFLSAQQLSLLQQKLLEAARAVALSPRVLLMDEPVGGLNPRESEILVDHIHQLRGRGMGIVLVEHNMNVVMRLADRVVVLQNGCRIAQGLPREVQMNPRVIEAYLGVRKCP